MVCTLVVLGGVYVFYFTDWFKPKIIHITSASRMTSRQARNNPSPDTVPVTFGLTPPYRLTEITVVPLVAWETNKLVLPLWHLIAETNTAQLKSFEYGQRIRGMKPAVAGSRAEPLQPDVTYRLFVTAGSAKGQHDFVAKPLN